MNLINVLIVILVAAVVWVICAALGLPAVIGIVAALLIIVVGIGNQARLP